MICDLAINLLLSSSRSRESDCTKSSCVVRGVQPKVKHDCQLAERKKPDSRGRSTVRYARTATPRSASTKGQAERTTEFVSSSLVCLNKRLC